jgi:hypothetical protein
MRSILLSLCGLTDPTVSCSPTTGKTICTIRQVPIYPHVRHLRVPYHTSITFPCGMNHLCSLLLLLPPHFLLLLLPCWVPTASACTCITLHNCQNTVLIPLYWGSWEQPPKQHPGVTSRGSGKQCRHEMNVMTILTPSVSKGIKGK